MSDSDSLNDMMISEMSNMTEINNRLLKTINSFFATISDETIRSYYNTDGETMFEALQKDLNYFRNVIPDNLERISKLKLIAGLNDEQIQKLDEIEKSAEDGLKILDDTQNIIKNIKEERLNNAIMGPTLQHLARATVFKHKIPPGNPMETAVLHEEYDSVPNEPSGGFRNRKNKTNNKKYAKKRTYKRPKKRVSKKNKTRKMKKNYL
jgi:hypothetical protein